MSSQRKKVLLDVVNEHIDLERQLYDAQRQLNSKDIELKALEHARVNDNKYLLKQRDEIQEKTLLRMLDYLRGRLEYIKNVEEHEVLAADWNHPYYQGLKTGAIRSLALASNWVRQELKNLKEERNDL